ncbi:hypothetical protein, partial [Tepidimonas sp.]|uniref:hypothetical protein n=1 Tax=Tepidimonas sp. TaxID=2002775 RepID=UPI003919ECE0
MDVQQQGAKARFLERSNDRRMMANKSFQRTVKKLRFLSSAEFKRYAHKHMSKLFILFLALLWSLSAAA